jgi:hypothetical protein
LRPYKITEKQELKTTDYAKRTAYGDWFNQFIVTHGEAIMDLLYHSDEAWFHLSGNVNSQNARLWTPKNPHALHESPLHSLKIGAWCAMSRKKIIRPIFFDETTKTKVYIYEILYPFFAHLTDEEFDHGYFGYFQHTSRESMNILQLVFGDRLISKPL